MHGIDFIQDLAVVMLVAGLVGWLCHRIGLSVIVGYLVAGMVVGPYTPPFSLVTEVERIETLSQLGLVFLMFGIGLNLSLRRLRRMGFPLAVATAANALLVYFLTRALGAAMQWTALETMFLAAMLMVSSSAIIGKILVEIGATHEKVGQAAMSLTVAEDVVAVVMLTLLTSLAKFGGGEARIGETIGVMGSFVVLAGIASLLIVPWLLRRLSLSVSVELQTICLAGVLLGVAVVAARAGYSLALGAFILGCIVAETAQKLQVERTFEGLRDVFSAVFFVGIGMQIDIRLLGEAWQLILGLALFSLLARPLTGMVAFMVTGTDPREALRVGLSTTPIGEFSLIIAQLGVNLAVVPPKFYPLAVGLSLLTSLAAPLLTRRSAAIADALLSRQPKWFTSGWTAYQGWLQRLQARGQRNLLWQLSRKRLVQIAIEVLLVTGVLVFSEQLFALVAPHLPREFLFPGAAQLFFWAGLALVALIPLLAIWRNVSALAMIIADVSTQGQATATRIKPIAETSIKVAAAVLMFFWLSAIVPAGQAGRWIPLAALALAAVALLLLRSRLVYWHSVMEVELQTRLGSTEGKATATNAPWLAQHSDWHLALTECVLPDLADVRGRTIGELGIRSKFGCTVAGIERQGVMIGNPSPATALFPLDKVLLLGDPAQIAAGKAFLTALTGKGGDSDFDEVRVDLVEIPRGSRLAGSTLAEIAPTRKTGVQVAGINRGGMRILNPGGDEKLLALDQVLALGSPDQIRAFREWAREGSA